MKLIYKSELSTSEFDAINDMWNEEYPVKLNNRFPLLLTDAKWYKHYLVYTDKQKIGAWAVVFQKDDQIRFSIIVASSEQGKGLGSWLINELKAAFTEFYGWVIDHNNDIKQNGEFYRSPHAFYLKQGLVNVADQRLDNEMIQAVLMKWEAH